MWESLLRPTNQHVVRFRLLTVVDAQGKAEVRVAEALSES